VSGGTHVGADNSPALGFPWRGAAGEALQHSPKLFLPQSKRQRKGRVRGLTGALATSANLLFRIHPIKDWTD